MGDKTDRDAELVMHCSLPFMGSYYLFFIFLFGFVKVSVVLPSFFKVSVSCFCHHALSGS